MALNIGRYKYRKYRIQLNFLSLRYGDWARPV